MQICTRRKIVDFCHNTHDVEVITDEHSTERWLVFHYNNSLVYGMFQTGRECNQVMQSKGKDWWGEKRTCQQVWSHAAASPGCTGDASVEGGVRDRSWRLAAASTCIIPYASPPYTHTVSHTEPSTPTLQNSQRHTGNLKFLCAYVQLSVFAVLLRVCVCVCVPGWRLKTCTVQLDDSAAFSPHGSIGCLLALS